MNNKKITVIIIIFLATLAILLYVSIHDRQRNGNNLTSLTSTPKPTIWPTPTPLVLDFKNGLSEEIEKLTPADFSSDFETLKKDF